MIDIPFRLLPHGEGLTPRYATDGAAGLDLSAAIPDDAPIELPPLGRRRVPTGIALALPAGYEAQVRPRSGLAARHGVTVLNAPGTVDADFRGEVEVILINLSDATFTIRRGERIAQMIIAPVTRITLVEADDLDATARGSDGFGSTGR